MKRILRTLGLISVALMLLLVTAVPVLAAAYYAVFLVTETDGNAYEKLPVIIYVDNDWMVDQGMMHATGMDTRVQSGGANIPHMVCDNKTLAVVDVPANSNKSLVYTMDKDSDNLSASLPTIPGYDGYVTVADNTTLELGDNFTVLVDGWWNTDNGTGKNAIEKPGAFKLLVSDTVSENITAGIYTDNLSPDAWADPAAFWTNEGQAIDEDYATAASTGAVGVGDWSEFIYFSYSGNSTIVAAWAKLLYTTPAGTNTVDIDTYRDDAWNNDYDGDLSTSSWHTCGFGSTLEFTAIRVRFQNDQGAPGGISFNEFYVMANHFSYSVTATSVESGEHEVKVDNLHNILINGNFENGDPPDDWTLVGAGASVNQDGVTYYIGSYSANLTRNGTNCFIYEVPSNWAQYRGETLTMGAWVNATVVNRGYLRISDSASTSASLTHSGDGNWDWLSVSHTVDAGATWLQARFEVISSDTTGYIDGAVLVHGSTVGTGGNFAIYVDDVCQDATFGDSTIASVPDNANQWVMMQNNVLPYADNITISVNGTQQLYFAPNAIIVGTVLPDRETATNNDGTFTWGSNPAGISANMTSFQPAAEAKAPAYVLGESPLFITATPNITSEFSIVPPGGTFPLAGVIATIASATDMPTPAQLPLLIIAAFVILAASLSVSAIIRQHGSGSILIKVLTIAAVMGVFIALGNFGIDFWMLFVFLIIGIALGFGSKQLGWQ